MVKCNYFATLKEICGGVITALQNDICLINIAYKKKTAQYILGTIKH